MEKWGGLGRRRCRGHVTVATPWTCSGRGRARSWTGFRHTTSSATSGSCAASRRLMHRLSLTAAPTSIGECDLPRFPAISRDLNGRSQRVEGQIARELPSSPTCDARRVWLLAQRSASRGLGLWMRATSPLNEELRPGVPTQGSCALPVSVATAQARPFCTPSVPFAVTNLLLSFSLSSAYTFCTPSIAIHMMRT